ncbi:MAG: T9SS type A sorting domain-containing protein, partial [bacterium]
STFNTGTMGWYRIQNVPAVAAPGEYNYVTNIGVYPHTAWASDTISFVKSETGNGTLVNDWFNSGDDFNAAGTASNPEEPLPSTFRLYPCFPNPFNPTTTIRFTLPQVALVKLEVFDVNGRSVGAIHELPLPPGTHDIPFDGSDLPSGIYIYRLIAGDWQTSGKMVLLK